MAANRPRYWLTPLFLAACLSSVRAISGTGSALPRVGGEGQGEGGTDTVVEHAIAGRLGHFDRAASTFEVRTSVDVGHTITFTTDTRLAGLGDAAVLSDLAGYPGTYLVVRCRLEGGRKVATAVQWVGSQELQTEEGRIVRLDKAWRSIIVSSILGSELYLLTDDPVIDTDDGVVSLRDFAGRPGDRVSLAYTTRDGHRIVHLLRLVSLRQTGRQRGSSIVTTVPPAGGHATLSRPR